MNRLRKVFNRHNAWVGLKVFGLLFGVVSVIVGSLGVAVTLFGMLLFQMANLGGTAVKAIVIPIANTGETGLGVSIGVILAGVVLLRKPLLWGLRQPLHGLRWLGRRFPSGGLIASPVRFYKSIVRFRDFLLAKINYLQGESAKWKALFTTLKLPYSMLRMAGFSPQMAMTLLFAGSAVGTGVVASEVMAEKNFNNGDSGVYAAPSSQPVMWDEEFNTLRVDLAGIAVGSITVEDTTLGTAYANSTLPSGETAPIIIGGKPATTNPAFTETFLETSYMLVDRWRCESLLITNTQANKLIVTGMVSDGQSISPVPGVPRMRGINGGNRAEDMHSKDSYFDQLKIQATTSGVSGRVDVLRLKNLYSKGGPCLIDRVKANVLEVRLSEIGGDSNLATKAFQIADSVVYKTFESNGNVEEVMAVPAVQ